LLGRREAAAWVADSVYRQAVYHVTTHEAALAIRRGGFDLGRRAGGRAWGNGVYGTPDQETIELDHRQLGEVGVVLELRVNIRRLLAVRLSRLSRRPPLEQLLAQVPDGLARFVDAGLTAPDRATALTTVVVGAGYDALEIVEERFTPIVGGSQLVVYDPRRVVVVTDDDGDP
jgi:hypothetical protein